MSSSRPVFKASGKQGCVFQGRFEKLKTKETCITVKSASTASPLNAAQYATKFMNDKTAYDNEMKAAEILTAAVADVSFAVYAVRGCIIEIQDLLSETDITQCGSQKPGFSPKPENEKLKSGVGYAIEMPFVPSQTLEEYNPNRRLTNEEGIALMTELQNAIGILQQLDIYHCDLHDGNVWIDQSGKIRIADFGTAQFSEEFRQDDIKSSIPSFVKIWSLVDSNERNGIQPSMIGNYMKNNPNFYPLIKLRKEQAGPSASRTSSAARTSSASRNLFGESSYSTPTTGQKRPRSSASPSTPKSNTARRLGF